MLDVSQFIPSEQQRFVRAFADRFFHRKKVAPSAVHLFMEECQEFLPEIPSGLESATLGAMQRLWKLGRNFGIGGSLISQRPQEIAKKALNMSGTTNAIGRRRTLGFIDYPDRGFIKAAPVLFLETKQ